MALLSGGLTARRFRVPGDTPPDWRERYRDRLNAMAFREPGQRMGKEEVEGWVQVHNLLDTEFDDFNTWLYGHYAVFALRVDKKSLPAKLFNATVDKAAKAWCKDRGVERCPGPVKKEIREKLEEDWLARALPRVSITEVVWNIEEGYVVIDSLSEGVGDRVRKRFHRSFGLAMLPWSPLDWLESGKIREAMLSSSPSPAGGGE